MKISKSMLYKILTVAAILILAAVMMIIGRGHTIYLDNKALDNPSYSAYYRTDVDVKNNEVQKLSARERGSATFMGQSVKVTVTYMETKNSQKQTATFKIKVPYGWDGIIINLPALIHGEPKSVYMSQFIETPVETSSAEEVVVTDEFVVSDI